MPRQPYKRPPSNHAVSHLYHKESPGLSAAIEASYGEKRKPTEDDRPPVSTFPGRKPVHIEGQMRLTDEPIEPQQAWGETSKETDA